MDPDLATVGDRRQAGGSDPVDHDDAGVGQGLGPEVRVAARDNRGGVDDGDDPGVDERLRARPVHVEVVDDGHVARTQPGQQVAGAPLQASGPDRPGWCVDRTFLNR